MLRVGLPAPGDFEPMAEERHDGCETFFGAALAAGKIHDQRVASETGDSTREPCIGVALRSPGAHCFRQSWRLTVEDTAGRFGRAIARAEAGAAGGEYEGRALRAERFELGRDRVFLVGQQTAGDFSVGPVLLEQRNYGRAGSVLLQALRATVGDGEDGKEHSAIVEATPPGES